ncbi:MAG: NADH:flavin oxidoreductase [Propionibacterium sp.]|nr:NADH:flavin oxidoreductase [Propionibacterium sp.]
MTDTDLTTNRTVFEEVQLGPVTLRNRTVKAATSEGRSPEGKVTDELIAFHRGFIDGGVGMTTLAYATVSKEGYSAPGQILMARENLPGLQEFTAAMHEGGGAVSAQLGHAGVVAHPRITGVQPIAPSKFKNPTSFTKAREMTHQDIKDVVRQFADAAELAAEAGFDAAELHFGHLYVVSSFFSPWINKRTDEYGGSIENRTRFALEIVDAVRDRVGSDIALIAKMSMDDGIKGSIWLDESVRTAELLDQQNKLDAIELTQGSSVYHQMYLFRGDIPVDDMAAQQKFPFNVGVRLLGKRILGDYPYYDMYMFESARQFVPKVKNTKLMLLGGINNHDHMQKGLDAGFDFVVMGRALLRQPDLVNRIEADRSTDGICIHCNKCMFTVYGKTHCVFEPQYARNA